jgi:hypothetical protein
MADKTKGDPTPSTPDATLKYEVVDGSGNVIPGAVARLLRVERDQTKILEMTLNHTLDGQYMMVDVPINLTAEKGEAEPALAQAAE